MFANQSLPRILGLLFGNTRDLEARIADRDAVIERLKSDIEWYRQQNIALQDSFLLSRGNKPTVAEAPPPPLEQPTRVIGRAESLAVEIEADKLVELMFYDPQEMEAKVEDLTKSNRARDKEILKRLEVRLAEMPPDSPFDGVVIG